MGQEIELKFLGDAGSLTRAVGLSTLGRFHRRGDPRTSDHTDIYFDTAERALACRGVTLRLRMEKEKAILTFKGAKAEVAGGLRREEVESQGLVADGLAWDSEPVRRAQAYTDGDPLQPILRLAAKRTTVEYVDRYDYLRMDADEVEASDGDRGVRFCEVELEDVSAGFAALSEAGRALVTAVPGLRPSSESKVERVWRVLEPAGRDRLITRFEVLTRAGFPLRLAAFATPSTAPEDALRAGRSWMALARLEGGAAPVHY